MNTEKQIIKGLDGFRTLVGTTIGPSQPLEVTQERIEKFCAAVDNDEWIHFDVERCKEAGFGTTIAPGMLTQAYFSKLWFDLVDIHDVPRMLFLGSDKIRLLTPIKCGQSFTMSATVQRVEEKENGVAVYLDVVWNIVGNTKPACIGTFIIRYMEK